MHNGFSSRLFPHPQREPAPLGPIRVPLPSNSEIAGQKTTSRCCSPGVDVRSWRAKPRSVKPSASALPPRGGSSPRRARKHTVSKVQAIRRAHCSRIPGSFPAIRAKATPSVPLVRLSRDTCVPAIPLSPPPGPAGTLRNEHAPAAWSPRADRRPAVALTGCARSQLPAGKSGEGPG